MTKLLALMHLVPNPPHGGEQRNHHVLAALAAGSELSVAALPRSIDNVTDWPLAEKFAEAPRFFARDHWAQSPQLAFRESFPEVPSRWPIRVQGNHSSALWQYLDTLDLSQWQSVFVGALGLVPYGIALKMRWPHLRLILDFDYLDPLYSWRQFRADRPFVISKPFYWGLRTVWRLLRFCRRWLPSFESVWVCSEPDRSWSQRWIGKGNYAVIPNGIDCQAFADISHQPESRILIMTGSMADGPNSDGAAWFAEQVWPRIRASVPDAMLKLVGRNPSESVMKLASEKGVMVTGEVPDVRPYLSSASVSIAPIRYGTGTRLKILEALAAGLPVVSTAVGAEGLDFRSGDELIIAHQPETFALECISLLQNSDKNMALAKAGRLAVRKYDWAVISAKIRSGIIPIDHSGGD